MVTKAHPLLAPIVSPSSLPSGLSHCPSPFMKQKSTGSSEGGGSVPPRPCVGSSCDSRSGPHPCLAPPLPHVQAALLVWDSEQTEHQFMISLIGKFQKPLYQLI